MKYGGLVDMGGGSKSKNLNYIHLYNLSINNFWMHD